MKMKKILIQFEFEVVEPRHDATNVNVNNVNDDNIPRAEIIDLTQQHSNNNASNQIQAIFEG